MSGERTRFDDELERLQALLAAVDGLSDETAKNAARELVKAVLQLHAAGLRDVLDIIDEAGSQPADTLAAKLAVSPKVCGLLLLHDLHPDDLTTRAERAVERLRPHLGVYGVRTEFLGLDDGAVHVRVTADGSAGRRLSADELRREIEDAVVTVAPDAAGTIIDGLESIAGTNEVFVPLSSLANRRADRRTEPPGTSRRRAGAAATEPDRP